jgi:hypothetical protein
MGERMGGPIALIVVFVGMAAGVAGLWIHRRRTPRLEAAHWLRIAVPRSPLPRAERARQ